MKRIANNLTKSEIEKGIIQSKNTLKYYRNKLAETGNELQYIEAEYEEWKERVDIKEKFLNCLKAKLKRLKNGKNSL